MKKSFWLLPLVAAIPLLAVTPQFWEIRTYDDFRKGKLTNLSLTSDDELILAPRFDMVYNTEQTLVSSAVADSKGNIYLGTGHDGKIFKVDAAGKGSMLVDLTELDVLALAVDSRDVLYAGTSPDGKVYKIENGTAAEFFNPKAKYIWSLVFDKQGRLLVGTGDKGVIYRVTPDGKGAPFYDTDETHIISMAMDRDGNVIAGGDPKGYIYRISPEGKAFVLYDSGMREIHSLAVAPNGTIYASAISGDGVPAPVLTPAAAAAAAAGANSSVTITVNAAEPQEIEVVESLEPVSPDTPRAQTRRTATDANAQSAVLEILPDGVVNTLWRSRGEMVFSVLPHDGKLLFSTGAKGRIYSLDGPKNTTLLLESTEEQTTRLLEVGNRLYAASSNIGKLFRIGDTLATSGTYESNVKDTDAVSSWGKLTWKSGAGDSIQVSTRTGNTSTPDRTWSDWQFVDAAGATSSPKARFIQWNAVLKADRSTSPRMSSVKVPFLQQNFRPEVTNIEVLPSGVALQKVPLNANSFSPNDPATLRANARAGQPKILPIPPRRGPQRGSQSFQWAATDKNQDTLIYDLYYRAENDRTWKVLKKDLEDNFYTINSDSLPDGTYVVRVVASDQPSNPPDIALRGEMESRPFTIDNTPPVVTMKLEGIDGRRARVAIEAADLTSTLNQAEVAIDTGDWRPLFPKDGIIDSKSESFSYISGDLAAGEHIIAFRVYDQNDNAGMSKLVVRIP